MTFTKPVAGPKVYLSRGPSGHAETFKREPTDEALKLMLGAVTLKIAIDGFIIKKKRERTHDDWSDVISYLGALVGIAPDKLPVECCVAFWAQVGFAREAEARAKELLQGN